jgi:hypothetical protein
MCRKNAKAEARARRVRKSNEEEEKRQQALREAAMKFAGSIRGSDPNRAQNARSEVRARIARRHGR